MRTLVASMCAVALVAGMTIGASPQQAGSGRRQPVSKADLERWKKDLSNWGRWGKEDEKGTLNLITAAKRKQAAALVTEGFSVSLAREADYQRDVDTTCGYASPSCGPYERRMEVVGVDWLTVRFHGYAHTHIDSLAHVSDDGKFYNGYVPDKAVSMEQGMSKNSVFVAHDGIFTRGILMDIPRLKGVPYLEPGTHIYPEDLEAWEKQAGIKVSPGDALFIRTGRWARRARLGPWDATQKVAGVNPSVIPWLKQRDVALLAGESPQDARPSVGDLAGLSVHNFALIYLGMSILDNVDLDALAEAAASRKRWEFLLTVAPLPLRGGTGSPVNPIATF